MKRLGALLLVLTLAACGSPAALPEVDHPSAAAPRPPGVSDPAVVTSPPPQADCFPEASYRPVSTLPAPGRMPPGSTMAAIVKRGRLIIGTDQNANLLSYLDPTTGDLAGFEIDMARWIAAALFPDGRTNPNRIQFRHITTADRIPVLQRGEVDMVIRTMTMNCARWKQIDFSSGYLWASQKLLVNRGSDITTIFDIGKRGGKICATSGSTSIVKIAAVPGVVPVSANLTVDCMLMLQQGQIDAVSTNDTILLGLAAQDPGTEIVGEPLSSELSGIGIQKGHVDLVRFVNKVLEGLRADGSLVNAYRNWLGALGEPPALPSDYRD
ncbi:glutamate ABC transporter substrate-binding protein [Cryptosporangium aurantiacum]|uniref:Amino acid ABC transporter substrate-binding protein, PAAT family n=1 Tax=Cryptosporangium aurantiacum TaxID=134849 RepID=A0A1M7RK00_9ACTN|nr:glutamate ABC transporter substrate-binding protein [Cryptosporangium aurantiacum]SHN46675.1 amino acid ABC transporter substrate-binding protein, PAAT family [Cryptosporangium aurantiacum]